MLVFVFRIHSKDCWYAFKINGHGSKGEHSKLKAVGSLHKRRPLLQAASDSLGYEALLKMRPVARYLLVKRDFVFNNTTINTSRSGKS